MQLINLSLSVLSPVVILTSPICTHVPACVSLLWLCFYSATVSFVGVCKCSTMLSYLVHFSHNINTLHLILLCVCSEPVLHVLSRALMVSICSLSLLCMLMNDLSDFVVLMIFCFQSDFVRCVQGLQMKYSLLAKTSALQQCLLMCTVAVK